jgi:hypothetical protein
MKRKLKLPAMWAKAREDVVAAVASDRIRLALGTVSAPLAPYMIRDLQKVVQEQIKTTTEFIDQDVKVAMEVFKQYPYTMPHYALISAAAIRAFQQGQVADPNVACHLMRQVLDRYLEARS